MKTYVKRSFPVERAREILEPGPIVLVTSAHKGAANVMTMGWHAMMEFSPSLLGCVISAANVSFDLIYKSGECVINVPAAHMIDAVVGIGNTDGDETDKFETFGLTKMKAKKVAAPLIKECFAHFECKIHDARLVNEYNFFIFKIVRALVAAKPRYPQTLHYHGGGVFTTDGAVLLRKARSFTKLKDEPNF